MPAWIPIGGALLLALTGTGCVTSYGEAPAEAALPDAWGLAAQCPAPGSEAERAAAAFPFPAALLRPDQTLLQWRDHQRRVVEALAKDVHFSAVTLAECEECAADDPAARLAAALALARRHDSSLLLLADDATDAWGRANYATTLLSLLTLGLLPLPQGPYEVDARLRLLLVDVERGAPLLCIESHDHSQGLLFGFDDDWGGMARIRQRAYRVATGDALEGLTARLAELAPLGAD
jgi:hypothetical protein